MDRPTREKLLELAAGGSLEERVRAAMKDFCFTLTIHEGKQRTWFGDCTVTVNRNVAFNFFTADVREDPGLEPYPVIRSERTETVNVRASDGTVPAFYLAAPEWRSAVESILRLAAGYADIRLLPDAWFEDEPIVRLLRQRLLIHPAVRSERGADWPPLLR